MYDIKIIRSARKTLSIEIDRDGQLVARAPKHMSERQIKKFVSEKSGWIEKHLALFEKARQSAESKPPLSETEIKKLTDEAKAYIPQRVEHYAKLLGVDYGRITIRNQKTKWGSCSSKGNLNFNCLLMLTPPEVIDSVVAHELCHRLYMNHSGDFYKSLYAVFPDYDSCSKWLKINGNAILLRRR